MRVRLRKARHGPRCTFVEPNQDKRPFAFQAIRCDGPRCTEGPEPYAMSALI